MNNEIETVKLKRQKGVDDLLPTEAFYYNDGGGGSSSNDVEWYRGSDGWVAFRFGPEIDPYDQQAINAESERRKVLNEKYIQELKDAGRYKEEYELTFNFQPLDAFDDSKFIGNSGENAYLIPDGDSLTPVLKIKL